MKRLVATTAALYAAHLVEEACTGMHDDPIIVAAWNAIAPLGPRHATYLVFQLTFAIGLVAALLVASGPRGRRFVGAAFAIVLLAEAHHSIRALYTHSYVSGLFTSVPLPFLGLLLLRKNLPCSITSSSPWASAASSSGSRRSSPHVPRRVSSVFRSTTTRPPRV